MDSTGGLMPDTKDWTWVIERPCAECGYDAAAVTPDRLADEVRREASGWLDRTRGVPAEVLALRVRPDAWSVLEYSCHVRDVHRIFDERLLLMRDRDEPTFADWDQDAAAVSGDYRRQDPWAVLTELVAAAERVAGSYAGLAADQWCRSGVRSNGSRFTVASLGAYHLHDVVHHRYDIDVLLGEAGR